MKDWYVVDATEVTVGDIVEFKDKIGRVMSIEQTLEDGLVFYVDGLGPAKSQTGKVEVYR